MFVRRRVRSFVMACAAVLATSSPALARSLVSRGGHTTMVGVNRVLRLLLDRAALADLRTRDQSVIPGFPLGDDRTVELTLHRFDPFAPGAHAETVDGGGRRRLALPDSAYFTGTITGEDDSHVLLIAGRDQVHGFVVSHGEVFPFGPTPGGGHRTYSLRDVDPTIHRAPGDFCANDLHPEAVAIPSAPETGDDVAVPPVADAPGTLRVANVAIETDQELRAKFASDQAELDYLTSLAAAASSIYERDVGVRLRFSYIRIWGAGTVDPWSATSTSAQLSEVQGYWNNAANNMAAIAGPRTVVHFISGKAVQGGIAYINVLCNPSYGYGVSQVFGSFDLSRPSQIWDVMVVAHELGHNFGSPHSHCYQPPLDECYNQEAGCYSGPVVVSRGTIMSYCHLLTGGLANIDMTFGSTVSARIDSTVAGASCLGTIATTTTTSSTTTTTVRPTTTTTITTTTTVRPTTTTTSTVRPTTTLPVTTTTLKTTTTVVTLLTTTTIRVTTTTVRPTTTTTAPPPTTTTLPSTTDTDGDGVIDAVDACPGTPAGDLVDARGCSVCPCAGPTPTGWSSRTAYLGCVRAEAKRRLASTTLTRKLERGTISAAMRSSCGRPKSTRCCTYASATDTTGRCQVVRASTCAATVANGRAADIGTGSCVPSPCAR